MIIFNPYELFPPGGGFDALAAPSSAGLTATSGYEDIATADLHTLAPPVGTTIVLDGSTAALTVTRTISGWMGSEANPINILFSGGKYTGKQVTFEDCRYVRVWDYVNENSDGNGMVVNGCKDCVWNGLTTSDSSGNAVRVVGSTPYIDANERLRFFNVTCTNWGTDGFTFHADGSANNNKTHFILVNCAMTSTGAPDSGIDATSGGFFVMKNVSANIKTNIGHGIQDFYLDGLVMSGVSGDSVILKNTDGVIFLKDVTGSGNIDLGTQGSLRGNDSEGNPSEVVNSTLGLAITYELKYNNVLTIQNNTAGSGTITTNVAPTNLIDALDLSMFVI